MTFEEWMKRYIDRVAARAEMDRSAAEEIVKDENLDYWYRGLCEKGISPEDAADEEQESSWVD